MKRTISLVVVLAMLVLALSATISVSALSTPSTVTTELHATSAVVFADHPDWGNFAIVYTDARVLPDGVTGLRTQMQALKPADANYDAAVVDGVLDGIKIDGKTVREWNVQAGSDYGAMIHFNGDDNDIRIYMDSSLVAFLDGSAHTIEFNAKFTAYSGTTMVPIKFNYSPTTKLWTEATVNVTGALVYAAHPDWGNFMRVDFDARVLAEGVSGLKTNIQALKPADADYNSAVVNGVLDGIKVDGKTIREWNVQAGSDYGAMVHFDGDANDIRIYMDASLVAFFNGDPHTFEITAAFKTYLLAVAVPASYTYSPVTELWKNDALVPLNVTDAVNYPAHPDWGNFTRVNLDGRVLPEGRTGLLTNAQALKSGDADYDAMIVDSILDGIKIDGKTVREWNTQAGSDYGAMVHFDGDENDIRIYMDASLVNFFDGYTHSIEVLDTLTVFTGASVKPYLMNYDPIGQTWTTEEVLPATPTPAPTPSPVSFFSSSALSMGGSPAIYGTVYFYLTNLITNFQRINVQAGGAGVSQELQDAVNDKILIDGKSVRQWNTENASGYSVMVAFETAASGSEFFGSLSIWVDTSGTCAFVPGTTHVVTFLPGLFGLNGAPINPAVFTWVPADLDWTQTAYSENNPQTGDTSFALLFALLAGAALLLFATRRTSVRG